MGKFLLQNLFIIRVVFIKTFCSKFTHFLKATPFRYCTKFSLVYLNGTAFETQNFLVGSTLGTVFTKKIFFVTYELAK